VDRGEAVLGHAEQGAQRPHPLQAQLPADRLERVEVRLGVYSESSSSSAR
jgi:hypothetical protein